MSRRLMKVLLWLSGLFLLIIFIQYPIQSNINSWKTMSLPLAGKTIVIDPGHGGVDGGAEGTDDTQEKEIALNVSQKLQNYLEQAGAIVYLTREGDYDLANDDTRGLSRRKAEDIQRRVHFIKEKEADFFLSIHLNSLPDKRWRGAQSFFYPGNEQSELLATSIQDEIKDNLENTERKALGMRQVYLLKYTEAPGALVEIGFLSNDEERELLKDKGYQQKMAESIYFGILKYTSED
ncbi:N-acetylmuramoyl-L-alanine amidase [Gracilibacillus halotolerans]|uniref:N-acetylmuramoyl-L-alanine amidase n=1 Tax=Gracilibacillus halotolerans TaxID=74386 RepID=A0A841RKG1_9BACI|nr:N-acetylmuramoyl-L-alanine amidase CwlD [Gracilibacillus halotolerans]MBB6512989.1 N-acetylmuramoyl-L-alanine amidase [Gracilibacillus halotolerans]